MPTPRETFLAALHRRLSASGAARACGCGGADKTNIIHFLREHYLLAVETFAIFGNERDLLALVFSTPFVCL